MRLVFDSRPVRLPRMGWGGKSRPRVSAAKQLRPDELNLVRQAIQDAQKVCRETNDSVECAIAWDTVDEIGRGLTTRIEHSRHYDADPLEAYCHENPETDECRTYD